MAKLSTEKRNDLPDSSFGIPSKRMYPLRDKDGKPDKAHIESAVRLFGHASNEDKPQLARNILKAANEAGMDTSGWEQVHTWAKKESSKPKTTKESYVDSFDDEITMEAANAAALLNVKNQVQKIVGSAFKFIGGSLVPKFTMQSNDKPEVALDVNADGNNVELTPKYNGKPDFMHKRKGIALMRAADVIANFAESIVAGYKPKPAMENAYIQIGNDVILQEQEDFDTFMDEVGYVEEDFVDREIHIVDEYAIQEHTVQVSSELLPYDQLLMEHSYDADKNTIEIDGKTMDAGTLGTQYVRDRMNKFIQEFGSDQLFFADGRSDEECLTDLHDAYVRESELIDYQFAEFIQEGKVWEKIKGGIKQVWEWIKQFFGWLGKMIMKFIRFIGGLFKKKTKSADQCVEEALGEGTVQEGAVVDIGKKAFEVVKSGTKKVVKIIGNRTSDIPEDTIELITKSIRVKVMQDNSSLTIHKMDSFGTKDITKSYDTNGRGKGLPKGRKDAENPNQSPVWSAYLSAYLIAGGTLKGYSFDDICKMVSGLCGELKTSGTISQKFEDNFCEMADKLLHSLERLGGFNFIAADVDDIWKDGIRIKFNEIREFGRRITSLSNRLNKIQLSDKQLSGTGRFEMAMEQLVKFLERVQMSFNQFSVEIDTMWMVDAKLTGVIKNGADLSKVVKSFVKAGIPTKYIRHNVLVICDYAMQDGAKPGLGQTRLCLIPHDGDVVYKVAMNGAGVTGNRTETRQTRTMEKFPSGRNLIAKIRDNWDDFVVTQDKCDFDSNIDPEDIVHMALDAIDRFYGTPDGCKYPYDFVDIHEGNVAFRHGTNEVIIFDYGFLRRREPTEPSSYEKAFDEAKRKHPNSALDHVKIDFSAVRKGKRIKDAYRYSSASDSVAPNDRPDSSFRI